GRWSDALRISTWSQEEQAMGHVSNAENPAVCSSLARSTLPKLVTCQRESASGRSLDPVSKFAICGPAKSGTLHGTDPSMPGAVKDLRDKGVKVDARRDEIAWLHPREAHGLFVELRKRERYE